MQQETSQKESAAEEASDVNVGNWQESPHPDRRIRQAVVVIHGIGEQRPMGTLRGFVDAVLIDDPEKSRKYRSKYRSKPDAMNNMRETRCLQMPRNRRAKQPPTDFYEYYWAHHMQDAKYTHVLSWLKNLIWRNPKIVPKALKPVYYISWGLILFAIVLFGSGLFAASTGPTSFFGDLNQQKLLFSGGLITFLAQWIGSYFILGHVADAARYLTPSPDNIETRNKIRSEGVNLLLNLHTSGKYSRIVVVGHSLGSVIGYDIIRNLWLELRKPNNPDFDHPQKQHELKSFEGEVEKLEEGDVTHDKIEAFHQYQHRLWQEFVNVGIPWLVTDFITLGSPLAHAQLLMADDQEDFELKKEQYEYPCCPPIMKEKKDEEEEKKKIYYNQIYTNKLNTNILRSLFIPHHGAPFSCVRWTNLYFPYQRIIFGDVIGGPLNGVFGKGIRDIDLKPSTKKYLDCTLASHTRYWKNNGVGKNNSLTELRKAMKLDFLREKNAKAEFVKDHKPSNTTGIDVLPPPEKLNSTTASPGRNQN